MRLGQLARKLELRPAEIVNYLALNSIQIESGGNTRLEDEHVKLILQKFAPQGLGDDLAEPGEEEKTEVQEPDTIIEESQIENSATSELLADTETKTEEKIEVIKAPKVELSGLKVLGKIELPELKKKEPTVTDGDSPSENSATPKEPRREKRAPYERRERPNQPQRPAKNPIALQREREAREAEERRKAAIENQKEKRTLHYLKKVNVAQPTKSVRIAEERIVEKPVVQAPAPKTLWGKFKRWINS